MARLTARERREAYLREHSYQKKTGKTFFPQVLLHDIIINLFFVLLIVGLATVSLIGVPGAAAPWRSRH